MTELIARQKDVVKTHSGLGMPTTIGSFAFLSAKANDSAVIVDKVCRTVALLVLPRLAADQIF